MTTDEIKKTVYKFIVNAKKGIDTSADFLNWYATVPAELKDFVCVVFLIFEEVVTGRISTDEAYEKYVAAVENLK